MSSADLSFALQENVELREQLDSMMIYDDEGELVCGTIPINDGGTLFAVHPDRNGSDDQPVDPPKPKKPLFPEGPQWAPSAKPKN